MKKNILLMMSCLLLSVTAWAQKTVLTGLVIDEQNNEPLVGASVVVKGTTKGTITDLDGKFSLELTKNTYDIVVSYVGYTTLDLSVDLASQTDITIKLNSSIVMKEVVVSADIAIDRKTPIAFSNISTLKLDEELSSQDLPMVLNTTPGAYATQSGGGDGDARINIRGFSQRNVAVMLDGIPVNDMENGQVYWSNWFGLNLVTKTMQVQRGLGASKLAVPSVGGTINILTKGIDAKGGFRFKQEAGAGGLYQTTVGFTSGRLRKGWGISGAFANRQNEGWVDMNYSKALFYYFRIDKELGKHLITFSGFGGPQEHGQRTFSTPIALTDASIARNLGVPETAINTVAAARGIDHGLRYNDAWGVLNGQPKQTRTNYYYKPQYSLRHSWSISKRTFLSNIAYLSIGRGGGTAMERTPQPDSSWQLPLQTVYETNQRPLVSSASIIRASVNNHFWYGMVSTVRHEVNKKLNVSGGIDLRSYKGEHYRTVHDMLGGRRFLGSRNARIDNGRTPLVKGDRYFYDYDGYVRWGGLFGLGEYTGRNWTAFVNASTSLSQYKYHDKMFAKTVTVDGQKLYTSYAARLTDVPQRVAIANGVMYTIDKPSQAMRDYAASNNLRMDSTSAQDQVVGWINLPSFVFKTGFSYNLNNRSSVFVNTGYLSRATRFTNVIYSVYDGNRDLGKIVPARNYENEKITAFEGGYNYRSPKFAVNVNAYYTLWKNKPVESSVLIPENPQDPQSERVPVQINGLGARHTGVEVDFVYEFTKKMKLEGSAAVADWIWNSKGIQTKLDGTITEFDATGVHVGDAAQISTSAGLRIEPIRFSYITLRGTYFGKNYANFDPESLQGANARRESWKMPNYFLSDLHAGYKIKRDGVFIDLRMSVLNLFNSTVITDARNNDNLGNVGGWQDFDAKSATVFFGLGRRWTVSMEVSF